MSANSFCPHCMSGQQQSTGPCSVCGGNLHDGNAIYQLPVGSLLRGRYLVGKALGAGGFGITYVGLDLTLRQKIAIKEYYPSGAANRDAGGQVSPVSQQEGSSFRVGLEHFINEGKILSRFVDDPNVVTVRDWFEENGTAYIVMEFISGRDLRQLLEERGPLSFSEAMAIITPAAECLGRIHAQGLLHGDISPSNIMLSDNGTVKLLDFGTARSQGSRSDFDSSLMLKPGYAPEEAYRQQAELGARVDIYALSATLYKLLTGHTPETAQDRLFEDRLQPPSQLGSQLTKAQEAALLRGMALREADRPESMDALLQLLNKDKLSLKDRLRGKRAKMLLTAAACGIFAVLGLFLLLPSDGSTSPGLPPAGTGASVAKTEEKPRIRITERSENAYPVPVCAGMEPMEGFERQDLVNFEGHHVSATACYAGNRQLCLELEFANDGETEFSLLGIDMLFHGQEIAGQTEFLELKPGESTVSAVWFNLDLLSLTGETGLQELTLDFWIYSEELSQEYMENKIGEACLIRLPGTLKLDSWGAKRPVLLYEGEDEKLSFRLECWGLSLRQDDYRGDILLQFTVTPNNGVKYYRFYSYCSGQPQVTADGVSVSEQPWGDDNVALVDPEQSFFFRIPFHYGYSRYAQPDEMNVLHSGLAFPEEIEISFHMDIDAVDEEPVELGPYRFAVDENGVGRLAE